MATKRRSVIFCLIAIIVGPGNGVLVAGPQFGNDGDENVSRNGDLDELHARQKLEWLQLRNPATGRIPAKIREKGLRFDRTIPMKEEILFRKNGMASPQSVQTYNWEQRGPYNIGGRTRALAIDVNDENTLLAGGVNGGMWKSTDDGNSWSVLPSTLTPAGKNSSQFSVVYNVVTNPANLNQDEVLAATWDGIMRSTDGGVTWDTTLSILFGFYSNIAVTSKGVFYAVLNYGAFPLLGGIFRSTDGANWVDITPSNFPVNTTQTAIGISPSNENVIYFLSDTVNGGQDSNILWKYAYLSGDGSDGGGSWEDRSANLPAYGGWYGNFNSQHGLTAPANSVKIIKLIYYIRGDDSTGTGSFYPVVYPGSIASSGTPSSYPKR